MVEQREERTFHEFSLLFNSTRSISLPLFSSHVNSNGKRIKSFFPLPLSPFAGLSACSFSSWSFHFIYRKNERRSRHAILRGLRVPGDTVLDVIVQMSMHSKLFKHIRRFGRNHEMDVTRYEKQPFSIQ